MLKELFLRLQTGGQLKTFFYLGQVTLGFLFLVALWMMRPRSPESNFRVREADFKKDLKPGNSPRALGETLAEAKIKRTQPLQLEGIRLDGTPYEILGVKPQATVDEIQQAYRQLMKRYHPDRVGLQGSREWKDAQKIAEAINQAKEQLLKGRIKF